MIGGRITEVPTEQLLSLVKTLERELGSNLVSCGLYGSAVRGGLIPKVSDVNLLIVLRRSTPEVHRQVADVLGRQRWANPVVVSRRELKRLFQIHPVKFRSIQRNFQLLAGADLLQKHQASPESVRFNCEQSLRNLQVETVHAYLRGRHSARAYRGFLAQIEIEIFVVISELLRLRGVTVPVDFRERLPLFEKHLKGDVTVLEGLLLVKERKLSLSPTRIESFHQRLTDFLDRALKELDRSA